MANDMSPACERPPLAITSFFAGATVAHGVFEDRFGRPRRRFTAQLFGQWDKETFVLDETLHYSDGQVERRVWRVLPGLDGRFSATSSDCIGSATGEHSADGWRMRYHFRLRIGQRSLVVGFDDRVYRAGPSAILNRATVHKLGIHLGDVLVVYEKPDRLTAPAFANAPAFTDAPAFTNAYDAVTGSRR
jgi:hypothetical protein